MYRDGRLNGFDAASVVEVIGSYAQLAERLGRPLPTDFDPHKPGIDEITWPAPGAGSTSLSVWDQPRARA